MTDREILEEHLAETQRHLTILDWVRDAMPTGISRMLAIVTVLLVFVSVLLGVIINKQVEAEHVRDHRILIIDRMATNDSLTGIKVDKLIETVTEIQLHQSQGETRGAINRGKLDTIVAAVVPLLKKPIIHSNLK